MFIKSSVSYANKKSLSKRKEENEALHLLTNNYNNGNKNHGISRPKQMGFLDKITVM